MPAEHCHDQPGRHAADPCITVRPVDEQTCGGEGAVRVRVAFDEARLQARDTPFGLALALEGCTTFGDPGAPALPRTSIHLAVPDGMWPTGVEVENHRTVVHGDGPVFVAPVQPLRPGQAVAPERDHAPYEACDPRQSADRPPEDRDDDTGIEPFPSPTIVLPDPDLYAQAAADPRIARPTALDQIGTTPVIRIELRPVRLNDCGQLELTTEFDVVVGYALRPRDPVAPDVLQRALAAQGVHDIDVERLIPLPERKIVSRAQARRDAELARALVANPQLIIDKWGNLPFLDLPAEYLVITDNQRWNPDTITPIGPVSGNMVAEFGRLAAWKRTRGVTAKVVTVTDIVQGRYGNFRTGSRDLPEVIRRFLQSVRERWGVAWVLLGGDVAVIPPRLTAGAVEGHMNVGTDNPPPDNASFWTGSFLKMHVVSPGTWWPGSWAPILVNPASGQLIPFDATGASASGGLGWYYTTSDTYGTRTTMVTNFVRVNGTAGVVNAQLQWLYEWNRIPTDFYYSSLQGHVWAYHDVDFWLGSFQIPYVYQPAHDWDALDNGLYGQYVGGADVDGVHWQTDVSVGRAPVQSEAEAETFVDKVIGYESFGDSRFVPIDGDWPRRVLLASSNWGDGPSMSPTPNDPPQDDRFHARTDVTVIKLATVPANYDQQLIADISDSDRRELPWNGEGPAGSRGWHYARSASDHALNAIHITVPFSGSLTIPIPSRWIVVHGPALERAPRTYILDNPAQDGSMEDQETLRVQLAADLPGLNQVTRLYSDETDLTPAQAAAGPVAHLTSSRIEDAMDAAPHIVSLSGHGSGWGCCAAGTATASLLTNRQPFIAYADSCLTNQIDMEDAFSETLITNPNGGAVAYVGNTRFSWIGLGDDHQRAFFHRLASTRHLGLLNDARTSAVDIAYWHAYARWAIFALNLLGDPEMPVWRSGRRRILPQIDWALPVIHEPLRVKIPKPPEPVDDIVVHLAQGDLELVARPDRDGIVTFDLGAAVPGELTLTVSAPDAVPFVKVLTCEAPRHAAGEWA